MQPLISTGRARPTHVSMSCQPALSPAAKSLFSRGSVRSSIMPARASLQQDE